MAKGYAHYIFCGGTIVTMEKENPSAGAFAVKGVTILAVEKSDEVFTLAGQSKQFVHLNDRQTLLPRARFIEPHSHATYYDRNAKIGE